MSTAIAFSTENPPKSEKVWLVVEPGPTSLGNVVERVALDVDSRVLPFAASLAAYRNELAKQRKQKLKAQWSRKSILEAFIAERMDAIVGEFQELFTKQGPLPTATGSEDDKAAMTAYVARVLAAEKRSSKK